MYRHSLISLISICSFSQLFLPQWFILISLIRSATVALEQVWPSSGIVPSQSLIQTGAMQWGWSPWEWPCYNIVFAHIGWRPSVSDALKDEE